MAEHRGEDGDALSWNRCREAFEFDGSLLDIYVFGTGTSDWDRFLDFIRSSPWTWSYGDEVSLLPESCEDLFANTDRVRASLSIDLGSIFVNCHFFTQEEIELDIDPREIQSQDDMERVLGFVRSLGRCLVREVVITGENMPHAVWFRYEPASDAIAFVEA